MSMRRLMPLGSAGLACLASSAAAQDFPMSYLRTFGPAGDPVTRLGRGLGIVSIVVMVVIAILLLLAVFRRRVQPPDPRELTVRRDEGGLNWIYVGVSLSTIVLIACAVWTMVTIAAVAMPRAADLTVRVTASQWWWQVRYESSDPSQIFTTANEIHIPVGTPVRLELASSDVIHSFWVPHLMGKTDVIPGQTNISWLQADRAGEYRGQCGEYCGAQHAHMALFIVADAPQDFAAWRQAQLRAAVAPVGDAVTRGEHVFVSHCAACHTVRGTGAGGIFGPDLTHLMSRKTIAAGVLPNNHGNLLAWIAGAQALKPGTRMPTMVLSADQLSDVGAYLVTLK
jgi:cytochrome c oxidase subunit 2